MTGAGDAAGEPAAQALERLARLHGIQPEFTDVWGQRRSVSDDTRRGVLTAMGVACDDPEAVRRSLDAVLAERRRRLLPPVLVVDQHQPLAVPVHLPPGTGTERVSWRVVEEHGAIHEGDCDASELRRRDGAGDDEPPLLGLDLALPTGYHELRLGVGGRHAHMPLVVVPAHCYLPEPLTAGARWWGLSAQLYGVRRTNDWGMGDFGALPELVDLCVRHGAALLGLNPLHALFPVWPEHASPYSPSSRLFLNVLYVDLERAVDVSGSNAARERLHAPETAAQLERLRGLELVDYREVSALKLPILELAFAEFAADPTSLRYRQFRQFCEAEGDGLLRHALFEALHEHFHGIDPQAAGWPSWPRPYQDPASTAVARFAETHAHRVDFHRWLQWLAEEQLAAAARHADDRDLAIGLYVDLAVSVDRCGAETWCNRHLYALDAAVGAPPDLYNVNGQNWGLPPINPQSLYESGYALFIETLRRNMRHAGALRIDHVMGLMRLYWIPAGSGADAGAYVSYPIDDLLGIVALESQRNRCVVIGEDLGTVPEGLLERLQQRRVLSYRLLYFEQEQDGRFRRPEDYLRQSLVAVTTHDLPTLRGWWEERDLAWRTELELFPNDELRRDARESRARERERLEQALADAGLDPAAEDDAVPIRAVHRYLARSPAMLMLLQLEDALGIAEQANLPGTVDAHPNWRRRLPVPLHALEQDSRFAAVVAAVAEERGAPTEPAALTTPAVPRAMYRLQLHRDFTFQQARDLVPYLHALGISHAYASPYLQSRAGSTHGYDINDHNAIDGEIGSEHDHAEWVAALHGRGMGHVLDIVPNHMGVMGSDNAWWLDVLEHGEAARHASYFDIEWHPSERALQGKILLPVLGAPYGEILDRGELVLRFDPADGRLVVQYFEHRLPIDPRHYPQVLNRPLPAPQPDAPVPGPLSESVLEELASISAAFAKLPRRSETNRAAVTERYRDSELLRQRLLRLYREVPAVAQRIEAQVASFSDGRALHELLERQAWRLAHFRTASDEINYRRFFDINDLAGLRTQDPEVFDAVHARVLALVEKGAVGGLRVDHPDGLYDPAGYFRRLRERCAELRPRDAPPIFLAVEKILAVDEPLPEDWDVSGTTGYEFGALLNGLFVDPAAEEPLSRCYAEFIGDRIDVEELEYRAKHVVMRRLLAGELQVLGNLLHRIGQSDPHTRDYTRSSLVEAIRELTACFPVYRTYVRGPVISEQDRQHFATAIRRARRRALSLDPGVFDFLHDVLLQRNAGSATRRRAMQDFTMKLQQFTAPVTAKGVEDTMFYRYARLLSLNEVGDSPARFGVSVTEFHRRNQERLARWPDSMLATSTHDTKRGEDMRARLNVLSECPDEWAARVMRWRELNRHLVQRVDDAPAPSPNDEYFLYQTLVGSWPIGGSNRGEREAYRERIETYLTKVMREAKVHSTWLSPNEPYERAVLAFAGALLDPERSAEFLADLTDFLGRIAPVGLLNGLAQTVLKLTVPGVPDIYQGSELWNFSLVDPDNRRPVDYARRRELLRRLGRRRHIVPADELLAAIDSGLPKLYVIRQVLALRRTLPELFERGEYLPLAVHGALGAHVCAFARRAQQGLVVVAVPRLIAGLCGPRGEPPLGDRWGDTELELPDGLLEGGAALTDVFTGRRLEPAAGRLPVRHLLASLPVSVAAARQAGREGGRSR
ncbi:MAG TPA: malto-oligosyltrehalose synthase [Pseudomonadales bacterium]